MTKRGDRSVVDSEGRGECRGIRLRTETEIETGGGNADEAGEKASMQDISSAAKERKTSIKVFPTQISTVFGCKTS